MACDARQVLVDGIQFSALNTPAIKAAQLQIAALALLSLDSGADVSLSAILERANTSGFCSLTRNSLRHATLQLLCEIKDSL